MADRGRDLKFNILSDTDKFDLTRPAQELEDLTRDLGKSGDAFDKFGTDAKQTAQKIDNAFDAIAKSSKSNLRRKMDDDVDHAKRKMSEVKEEAHQTARESLASFTGAASFTDAAQEIAANAGAIFGPIGLAIGGLLSAGIYKFTTAWSENSAKIKQDAEDMFQAIIDGQGRVDQAFIDSKVKDITKPGGDYDRLSKLAKEAKININDLVLAKAGDADATARVSAQIKANATALTRHKVITDADKTAQDAALLPLKKVKDEISGQARASDAAKSAWQRRKEVMEQPIVAKFNGHQAALDADNTRARLEAATRHPVVFRASLDPSAAYQTFRQMERDFANSQVTVRARP